jgi:hypothetical protein
MIDNLGWFEDNKIVFYKQVVGAFIPFSLNEKHSFDSLS